MEQKR